MDPSFALSIAASAVQFVDFGCRLFSITRELYNSGDEALKCYKQSGDAAARLEELIRGLRDQLREHASGQLVPGDRALVTICNDCIELANQLRSRLQHLKTSARHRGWQSFQKAFLSLWSRKVVEAISLRLQRYSEEIRMHMLVSISKKLEKLSLSNSEEPSGLNQDLQCRFRTLIDVLDSVRSHVKDSIERKASWAERELDDATDHSLLASLRFQSMGLRYEEVREAHRNTFQWVFQLDGSDRPNRWHDIGNWLSGDGRLYWVSGKAGSGNSTLMRYIYSHEETTHSLRNWSPDVLVAKYFFWNSGTKEQRSQEGLLRCLLFEALDQRRDLIRQVVPEQWEHGRSLGIRSHDTATWSLAALKRAFERLTKMATDHFKMCFFVDGLDECEGSEGSGTHRAMGKYLLSVTSQYVKICLSGRPRRDFAEIFDQCPTLRLQDLTETDMRTYVSDELIQNDRMETLQELDPEPLTSFVDEIVCRAEGVFLWVKLVLNSIISGIGRRETASELKSRLWRLPSGLNDLYNHMFDQIDRSDMQKAAQVIRIFEASGYHASVTRIGFALEATYTKAIASSWDEWSPQDPVLLQKRTAATIESTCLGFIELRKGSRDIDRCASDCDAWGSDERLPSIIQCLASTRLYYIHRSVREYVLKKEIQQKLLSDTPKGFNPVLSNLMASVMMSKMLPSIYLQKIVLTPRRLDVFSSDFGWQPSDPSKWGWDSSTRSRISHLLSLLFCLQYSIVRYGRASLDDAEFVDNVPDQEARKFEADFFLGATTSGCPFWAKQRVKLIRRFPKSDRSLLSIAFGGGSIPYYSPLQFHLFYGPDLLEFVEFLLQHGANSNDAWSENEPERSIWGIVLVSLDNDLSDASCMLSDEELELRVRYLRTFLEHGADTETELKVPYSTDTGKEEQYIVSAESVIVRFEGLGVVGMYEARDIFERNRAERWKNTKPTRFREVGSGLTSKRARDVSDSDGRSRGALHKKVNRSPFTG